MSIGTIHTAVRHGRRAVLCVVVAAVGPLAASTAQASAATISGTLVGLNSTPLPNARLNIGSSSVITDAKGSFELTIAAGTYPLEVTGYNDENKSSTPYYSQFSGTATIAGSVEETLTLPIHALTVHLEGPSGNPVAATPIGGNNESIGGSIEGALAPGLTITSGYFYLNQPEGTTDASGNTTIPVPDTKTPWTGLRVIPPNTTGLSSAYLPAGGPDGPASTTLRLQTGSSISGTLVGLNNMPLPSARLNVGSSSLITGANGSFEFTIASGTYPLELTGYNDEGKGFAPYYSQFTGTATIAGSVNETLALPLHPLTVHVEGPAGEAVPGTTFGGNNESISGSIDGSLAPGFAITSGYFYLNQPEGTTDANGNTTIPVPNTKTPWSGLRVTPPASSGFASQNLQIGGLSATENGTVKVGTNAGTISGTLVGLNNTPLSFARLNVGSSSATTGANGAFEFTIANGTYPLELTGYNDENNSSAPYYSQFSGTAAIAGNVKETLALPLHPLAVHVEGPTGEPVPATTLGGNNESISGSIDGSLAPGLAITSGYFYLNQPEGTTDANGNTTIPVPNTKSPWSGLRVIPPAASHLASTSLPVGGMAATESVTIKLTAAPIPTLTKLSVKKAPAAGGTTVLLTGTGLSETTAVRFSAVNATFEVLSATSVRAVAPPSTSGVTQVTVTTAGGTTATSKKTQFKFLNPTVSAVSPASGPAAGGATVEITGSGFAPGNGTTTVLFGKTPATSVVCMSTTACSLTTPTGKSGSAVDVIAAVGKAKSKKTSADRYGFL